MKRCAYCGRESEDEARACDGCGLELPSAVSSSIFPSSFLGRRVAFWVIIALIAVVVLAVGIPDFIKAHRVENGPAWANRLRQIDAAKAQWALTYNKSTNDVPTWVDISQYIFHPSDIFPGFTYTNGMLVSSAGEIYRIGRVGEPPTCSKDGKIFTLP